MEKENIDSSRDSYLIKFLISVFNIMAVIRNAYFKHIKIKYLCYSDNARRCRKADLETSRLFYDRF